MAEKTLIAGYVSENEKRYSCLQCVDKLEKPRVVLFKAELTGKEKCSFCKKSLGDETVSTQEPLED